MAEHSAVNRRVVGSSPTCGANFSDVPDVKKGFSSLSRHGLSQLSHKVLALDADMAFTLFFVWPFSESHGPWRGRQVGWRRLQPSQSIEA